MAYDDTNSGVLFQNDKEGNEKRPDYKGKLNVNGKEFEIAGWKRVSQKTGQPFLSIKVSEPREGAGYDSFKKTGEQLKAKPKDEVYELPDETPIDLSEIPF